MPRRSSTCISPCSTNCTRASARLVRSRRSFRRRIDAPAPPRLIERDLTGSDPTRAWVRLPSGKRLDLLHPTPFDWDDGDLAVGLARTYRWGGHSRWPLPLSVAQHSLMVLVMHRAAHERGGRRRSDTGAELRELLHDADEGLLGFDCISVVKPFLGEAYRALTADLQRAVAIRYGLKPYTAPEERAHKRHDRVAAASEAMHVVGWTREEVRTTLRIPFEPLADDPLAALYGDEPWRPWPPDLAASRFLAVLHDLTAGR